MWVKKESNVFQFGVDAYPKWFSNRIGYDISLKEMGGIVYALINGQTVFKGEYIKKNGNGEVIKLNSYQISKIKK